MAGRRPGDVLWPEGVEAAAHSDGGGRGRAVAQIGELAQYGCEIRVRSYPPGWSTLPMPSMVEKARKTNVHWAAARASPPAWRKSWPSCAARAAGGALLLGVISFSHLLSADDSVDWNVESMLRAMRSMDVRSTPSAAPRLERVARLARQVLVDGEDEVDEALLHLRLHHLHHPKVVVDDPAAWVAVVDREVARVRVAVEEAVPADLLEVAGELGGEVDGSKASRASASESEILTPGQYSIVITLDDERSRYVLGTLIASCSQSCRRTPPRRAVRC